MHIAMIGPRTVYPHPEAGLDAYVRGLSEYLASRGHTITIYCHKKRRGSPEETPPGIALKRVGTLKSHHFDTLLYALRASLRAIREKADIIHFHGGSALFAWIARLGGKRVVVTIHSREWRSSSTPWLLRPLHFLAEWIGCRVAHRVSTVSQTVREELQKKYKREVSYIPLGMTTQFSEGTGEIATLRLKPKNYILSLGRIEKGKGIEFILEALKSMEALLPYPFVVAGEPLYNISYCETLKTMAGPNVLFIGRVIGPLKHALLANALLYVQASEAEGLSLSLLEAMSHGCPVLVSDIPQNKEAVGVAGFYFRNKNVEDLRLQLKRLLGDLQRLEKAGEKGRQKIQDEYSWESIESRLSQLYALC